MRRPLLAALAAAATLSLSTVALASSADAAPSKTGQSHRNTHVCSAPVAGSVGCDAIRHDTVDSNGTVRPNVTPSGYGPADIESAYGLPTATPATAIGTKTVAIVDAYDDPNAALDLATYRTQYGLPACTVSNGCFSKVSQTGSTTSLPRANGGWAQEISLDLDMVSSACPACKILLVEASSATNANLNTAVAYAASQNVAAISNSYGGSDTSGSSYPAYTDAADAGIAVTASTGDSGYGAQSPATYQGVVAVGGTSLSRSGDTRGWTETAWSGAGSGCSTHNAKPSYQDPTATQCPKGKAAADVSAVADPNHGVAVYDSYAYQGYKGWMIFGGTSASSPIIASVYALAGNYGTSAGDYTWQHASGLNDVTSGANGPCPTKVWCTADIGWDGPTGLGTPNGTAAF